VFIDTAVKTIETVSNGNKTLTRISGITQRDKPAIVHLVLWTHSPV
jgi:hypothetical protein